MSARAKAALPSGTRNELMEQHVTARQRRDAALLGSDEYRRAAEDVARIEIDIARLEEPEPAVKPA